MENAVMFFPLAILFNFTRKETQFYKYISRWTFLSTENCHILLLLFTKGAIPLITCCRIALS